MEVNKALKTSRGTVVFQGELSQEEHDYVLTAGLNFLLENGALPFTTVNSENMANLSPDLPGDTPN